MHDDTITDEDLARAEHDGACEDGLARARERRRYSALPVRDRAWVARWDGARPEVVAALAGDAHWHVRAALARRPDLSSNAVAQLAADQDPDIRAMVALRSDLEPDVAAMLARDSVWYVRGTLAQFGRIDVAAALARDPDCRVRRIVAERPGLLTERRRDLPAALRDQLAADPHCYVRHVIAPRHTPPPSSRHPGASPERGPFPTTRRAARGRGKKKE